MKENNLIIEVRVKPLARKTALAGLYADRLKVQVSAAPDKGKANRELVDLIAKEFDIAKSDVTIIKGQKSRNKTIVLSGPAEKLKRRYEEIKNSNH